MTFGCRNGNFSSVQTISSYSSCSTAEGTPTYASNSIIINFKISNHCDGMISCNLVIVMFNAMMHIDRS